MNPNVKTTLIAIPVLTLLVLMIANLVLLAKLTRDNEAILEYLAREKESPPQVVRQEVQKPEATKPRPQPSKPVELPRVTVTYGSPSSLHRSAVQRTMMLPPQKPKIEEDVPKPPE